MHIASAGSPIGTRTTRMMVQRSALWFSCLLLASGSISRAGGHVIPDPVAPPSCVVPPTGLHQTLEGRSGKGWQQEPSGATGPFTVAQGCLLAVWTVEGGVQFFRNGSEVHLKGWDWTSPPPAFHCICEKDEVLISAGGAYENFLHQHVDPRQTRHNDRYCNRKMRMVNNERRSCKPSNTFIHKSKEEVVKVCTSTNPIRGTNNHCSRLEFKLTDCNLTNQNPCKYQASNLNERIIITCRDTRPIHFKKHQPQCP
ncbi:hypothetical protein GJAV_G00197170 [Gymnothorax javanicus]|nr:hypothetical protein GJAV_G00197170 [Gymnothorax javanicus]